MVCIRPVFDPETSRNYVLHDIPLERAPDKQSIICLLCRQDSWHGSKTWPCPVVKPTRTPANRQQKVHHGMDTPCTQYMGHHGTKTTQYHPGSQRSIRSGLALEDLRWLSGIRHVAFLNLRREFRPERGLTWQDSAALVSSCCVRWTSQFLRNFKKHVFLHNRTG